MKYRHSYHAGNFADIHKHVTLLALLAALRRKEKGFAYLETHAGRGLYDVSSPTEASTAGVGKFTAAQHAAPELQDFTRLIADVRSKQRERSHAYPGSPLIAAHELRAQDRAVFCELVPTEARALDKVLQGAAQFRIEEGDGFERLRAWLPPPERRGLILIDPPYEETRDFERVVAAVTDALRRFETGVIATWFPIKDERDTAAWTASFARAVQRETLSSELWLYPRDSRVALNGSGMLIVNPPYLLADRMAAWLPELQTSLAVANTGGTHIRTLHPPRQ